MTDLYIKTILGGPANGEEVPSDWETIATWDRTGAPTYVYEERAYNVGGRRYHVWVPALVPDASTQEIIHWHAAVFRETNLSAQQQLLRESMAAGAQYTQVIMVVAYATLIAFLTTFKETFTPGTALAAAIALALSVLAFIGWELFGMVIRGRSGIQIAKAIKDPHDHMAKMEEYRERTATFAVKFGRIWLSVMGLAVVAALTSFIVMGSAMLHGAWLEYAENGTCERGANR